MARPELTISLASARTIVVLPISSCPAHRTTHGQEFIVTTSHYLGR